VTSGLFHPQPFRILGDKVPRQQAQAQVPRQRPVVTALEVGEAQF
jgi:hypothetical protein